MARSIAILFVVVVLALFAAAAQAKNSCDVRSSQAASGSWSDGTYTYQQYTLTVTNTGSRVLSSAQIRLSLAPGVIISQYWSLDAKDAATNTFTLPNWGGVQAGSSQSAGYIIRSTQALIAAPVVTVETITCAGPATSETIQLVVGTQSGPVQGFVQDDIARAFLGIPFADLPQRFSVASTASAWSGVYNASTFPKPCVQSSTLGVEDCLYLNVFTPKTAKAGDKLPVMVWIHGGRYWTGQTDQYQGQWLAGNGNVILVTIQYRLNTFGFFATPELVESGSTNLGFQDQILAIEWVKNNIASFGGDGSEISLFGESAGGNAAMLHLMVHKYTNPGAYLDYAQNVILQSTWQWVMPTIEQQLNASRKFAASKGCNQTASADILACMRALPANKAVSTSGYVNYFQPSVDGVFLTDQPYNLIKRGEYNTNANVIIGYTQDEGNYLANSRSSWKPPTANLTYADYVRIVGTNSLSFWLTPAQIDETLARYADSTAKLGYWYGIAELLGQFYITCGSTFAAPYFAQHSPTYAYIWNYTSPNYPDQFLQAAHGNELPYIFNATVYTAYEFAPIDYAHSARMLASWARIATRSRPDTSVWPRYTANNPVAYMWEQTDLNLNPPAKVVPFFRSNLCSFWEPFFSQNSAVQP